MKILDGRLVKENILSDLKKKVSVLDRSLGLTVIQIGKNIASDIYVNQKRKMALELGYKFNYIKLDSDVSEEYILELIDRLNNDDMVDGILVQMPIPKHFNWDIIRNRISPLKDVDGLTDINLGRLVTDNTNSLYSCTAYAVMEMLNYYNIDVDGANVVVVGRSNLVGKPVFNLLINNNATVTLCHSNTKDLASITSKADILVVGVGKSNFITKDMVKDGAIVIDVGVNMVDGKLCGDVNFNDVYDKVSYITPVPFGIGQVTVAGLAKNVYKAYNIRKMLD